MLRSLTCKEGLKEKKERKHGPEVVKCQDCFVISNSKAQACRDPTHTPQVDSKILSVLPSFQK
jgi:hypothetical protein